MFGKRNSGSTFQVTSLSRSMAKKPSSAHYHELTDGWTRSMLNLPLSKHSHGHMLSAQRLPPLPLSNTRLQQMSNRSQTFKRTSICPHHDEDPSVTYPRAAAELSAASCYTRCGDRFADGDLNQLLQLHVNVYALFPTTRAVVVQSARCWLSDTL